MAGKWTRRVLLGLPAALALIVLAAGTRIVPPIFGRIVDAATGKPVRGVLVSLEYERIGGLGPAQTFVHSPATTNRWGWFWLMPTIAWSDAFALVLPTMTGPWLTINHMPVDGHGSFKDAEVSALYDPMSKRVGMKVSNPAYFPLTVSYDPRQTCDGWQAWFATCVDGRSWFNVTIPLTPTLETPDPCASSGEPIAQYGDFGVITVTIEEWVGHQEPREERRDLLNSKPPYAARGVATNETRPEGTIRMYRGPRVTAADWVSGNRYVRVYSEPPMEKQSAVIEFVLRSFPSTLR